jgi:ABC-type multidrug transport system fused ATPase/permease subunit
MNYFNQLYLTVFNRFKASLKQKANTIALFYVSIVEIAIMLLLGTFFIKFLDQMKVVVMNGLNYSGRKRLILNAKLSKRKDLEYSLFILISLPFGLFGLSLMMLKVL